MPLPRQWHDANNAVKPVRTRPTKLVRLQLWEKVLDHERKKREDDENAERVGKQARPDHTNLGRASASTICVRIRPPSSVEVSPNEKPASAANVNCRSALAHSFPRQRSLGAPSLGIECLLFHDPVPRAGRYDLRGVAAGWQAIMRPFARSDGKARDGWNPFDIHSTGPYEAALQLRLRNRRLGIWESAGSLTGRRLTQIGPVSTRFSAP